MRSERETFQLSGPRHLTNIDWLNPHDRRRIAASLVQGVYVLERDRQERRVGPRAHAKMWWSFFQFHLLHTFIDSVDGSIFGAVYKWSKNTRPPGAPKIVVAFRGTVNRPDSFARDLWMGLNVITNGLHTTCRFHTAFDTVKTKVEMHGAENVWIAGHSLGAAMAMLAGRKIAEEEGHFLEAHLFNPPFVTPAVERIMNEEVKCGFHFTRSLLTAGLAMTLQDKRILAESQRSFSILLSWVPCLYINPKDDFCSGYIGFFTNQKAMKQMGAVGIAKLAAQHSISAMVLSAFGKESKAAHLIPSARLNVNLSPAPDFRRAHGIRQWWAPDVRIRCIEYRLLSVQPRAATIRGQLSIVCARRRLFQL